MKKFKSLPAKGRENFRMIFFFSVFSRLFAGKLSLFF
jgi:hypothetical protein